MLTVLFMASCNKDGFKIFDTDITITKSFDVDIPDNSPVHSLTLEKTIDATTEPDLQSYVNRIDTYKVNSISYSISDYVGETTILTEGTIIVESKDGVNLGTAVLTNVNLENLNNAGEQVLPFTTSELNAMANALKTDNVVDIVMATTIDNDPVAFTLQVHFDLTIEYRVFD